MSTVDRVNITIILHTYFWEAFCLPLLPNPLTFFVNYLSVLCHLGFFSNFVRKETHCFTWFYDAVIITLTKSNLGRRRCISLPVCASNWITLHYRQYDELQPLFKINSSSLKLFCTIFYHRDVKPFRLCWHYNFECFSVIYSTSYTH